MEYYALLISNYNYYKMKEVQTISKIQDIQKPPFPRGTQKKIENVEIETKF